MKNKRFGAAFVILGGLLMISLILNICIGSVNVPLKDIPGIFLKSGANETYRDIVLNIRFPRALAAAILGLVVLLCPGYLLQTFFHNPIAGPFTLCHFNQGLNWWLPL